MNIDGLIKILDKAVLVYDAMAFTGDLDNDKDYYLTMAKKIEKDIIILERYEDKHPST